MAYESQEDFKIELGGDLVGIYKNSDTKVVDFDLGSGKNLIDSLEEEIDHSEKVVSEIGFVKEKLVLGECTLVEKVLSNSCRSITDLPPVLVSEILNCLDPKELGIVSCVSTSLYKVAAEHHVWSGAFPLM